VLVALGLAGVDAVDLHGPVCRDAVGADLEGALEVVELSLHGGDSEVFDLELDARVDRVDLPGPGGEGGRRGCAGNC
jgi:hypothetical protein